MLTGQEILNNIQKGHIEISNFDIKRLNPNSYNLRLMNKLKYYDYDRYIDSKLDNLMKEIEIPETGLVLQPGVLYIGSTIESTYTDKFVPMLSGRSSIGRLGIDIHKTAGFGDIGFNGKWTLEIAATIPVKIYPEMEICQIYFDEPTGDANIMYNGRYQNQSEPVGSRLFLSE